MPGWLFVHLFIGERRRPNSGAASLVTHGEEHHELPVWVKLAPLPSPWRSASPSPTTITSCIPTGAARPRQALPRLLYLFLYNKWYFDELYDFLFVRPAKRLGRFLWKSGDGTIIDGLGPDGIAARVLDVTRGAVRLQTGYVYHYAFAMLIGVAAARHLVHLRRRRAQP